MNASHRLVIKDAFWQLAGRLISAFFWFITIKIITPYLWPLRYGDYSTILKYFAIWTALADLWLYVLAVRRLWALKESSSEVDRQQLSSEYGKFVGTRLIIMSIVYIVALVVAYCLPAYTSNPYLVWGLPFGMIFSASFMFAGIQQLPLQIFWKMEKLSWSLIVARLSQIAILIPLVFWLFDDMVFDGSTLSLVAFCGVMFSVVASSLGQNIQIHMSSQKLLKLRILFDWKFTKDIIVRNWQYGVSYFLSSFHTLIVLLFLWWFFPTSSGHDYTWYWALALSLIEILLIIPSALWNSLLHKISRYSVYYKRKSIGNLFLLVTFIWGLIALNFWLFAPYIIRIVSWKAFLWSFDSWVHWWSDQVLVFLWIVLLWSFIKQVYNYLFVAVDKQNVLLPINFVWVVIGIILGVIIIPRYWLFWWAITQLMIEFLFMIGAWWMAKRLRITPFISRSVLKKMIGVFILLLCLWSSFLFFGDMSLLMFVWVAIFLNFLWLVLFYPTLKRLAKWLTFDEYQSDDSSVITY